MVKPCGISSASVDPHGSAEPSRARTTHVTGDVALSPALSLVPWESLVGVNQHIVPVCVLALRGL